MGKARRKRQKTEERFEEMYRLVRAWETYCLYVDALLSCCKHLGYLQPFPRIAPFDNYPRLRQDILSCHCPGFSLDDFEDKFIGPDNKKTNFGFGSLRFVPWTVLHWYSKSNVVFPLLGDFHDFVYDIPHTNLCWGDVEWPFDSFAITLEKPFWGGEYRIGDEIIHNQYDCIIVTSHIEEKFSPPIKVIEFRLVSSGINNYNYLTQEQENLLKQYFCKAKKDGSWDKLWQFLRTIEVNRDIESPHYAVFLFDKIARTRVSESIDYLTDKAVQIMTKDGHPVQRYKERMPIEGNIAVRYIVGFCCALSMAGEYLDLPDNCTQGSSRAPTNVSGKSRESKTPSTRELFYLKERTVHLNVRRQDEAKEIINECQEGKRTVGPHYRRPHYRLLSGGKKNQPKTVKVAGTLVRPDLAAQGVPLVGSNRKYVLK